MSDEVVTSDRTRSLWQAENYVRGVAPFVGHVVGVRYADRCRARDVNRSGSGYVEHVLTRSGGREDHIPHSRVKRLDLNSASRRH